MNTDAADALVDRVAAAIHATEYGRYDDTAVRDHNKHTWPCVGETVREGFRVYARAALNTIGPVQGDAELDGNYELLIGEIRSVRAHLAAALSERDAYEQRNFQLASQLEQILDGGGVP